MFPFACKDFVIEHSQLLKDSYLCLTGHSLLPDQSDEAMFAEALFHAPYALVSHNTKDDPIFNYANQAALKLFEFSWQEFVQLPSRLSAEPVAQAERARLLEEVTKKGFISDYKGIRISKTGKRFLIRNAIVWNLYDHSGEYKGQAARFRDWVYLE